MNVKINFIYSQMGFFLRGDTSEEQTKRFCQYIKDMKKKHQDRRNKHMMADYCFIL